MCVFACECVCEGVAEGVRVWVLPSYLWRTSRTSRCARARARADGRECRGRCGTIARAYSEYPSVSTLSTPVPSQTTAARARFCVCGSASRVRSRARVCELGRACVRVCACMSLSNRLCFCACLFASVCALVAQPFTICGVANGPSYALPRSASSCSRSRTTICSRARAVSLWVCACMHVCVCVCVCVCVFACVCV